MKIINIIGLVLVIIAFILIGHYINEVHEASWRYWMNFDSYSYNFPDYRSITTEAALVMVPFTIFFVLAYIWNIVKVKTNTTKVMSIIGLSFSLLIVLINLVVLADPGGLSFDESGGFFMIYHIINLAFFIVLLVQAVRYENRKSNDDSYGDVLDTEIV